MIDLHVHSTYSDGDKTPQQLALLCRQRGIDVFALTDHDTVDGIIEANEAAKKYGVQLVPGIEISAGDEEKEIHVVGLFVDETCADLRRYCQKCRVIRNERGHQIVEKLRQMGVEITPEEEEQIVYSRARIGHLLVEKGYAPTMRMAFQKYLSPDGKAYVPKKRISIERAIELIHKAKGVAILAHLNTVDSDREVLRQKVKKWAEMGLDGIECYYSEYTESFSAFCIKLAMEENLLRSGGSDYHGDRKKGLELGKGYGNLYVPDKLCKEIALRTLEKRRERK
jgi:predicted metal-dependent phosphoesterase TrpH